jgi:hypothetical protein
MKKIVVLLFAIILVSCGTKEVSNTVVSEPIVESKIEFANPAFMSGSDFGSFFLSMLKTQNYDMAMKFVSKESIDLYGKEAIESALKGYQYNYNLNLVSVDASASVLKYTTNEFATGKFKTMRYVVENDTCKVILSKKLEIFGNE